MVLEPVTLFSMVSRQLLPRSRLELPLQQVQQHRQAIDQLALFAAPHALDLFRDVLDVGFGQPPARSSAACSLAQA